MTKWLTLFALGAGLLGCAEPRPTEIDEPPESSASSEEGAPQYQIFGGGGAAKISNVGAKCAADNECKGSAARCITSVPLINQPLEQGHCTATCTRDNECGTGGGCPLAQIANLAKTFLPDAGALVGGLSICLPKCKADSDCPTDLPCQAIPIPSIPLLLTAPNSKYCLPPLPKVVDGGILLPDGGILTLPDGGFRLPDGGVPSIPGFPGGAFPGFPGN